jgi:hypothetical protein
MDATVDAASVSFVQTKEKASEMARSLRLVPCTPRDLNPEPTD